VRLLTTGEVARELGVSRAAVLSWVRDGKLTPTLTTPGGHHRFDLDDVRRQLREQRQQGNDK
jgi:excisionase family DNA binding protein